MGGGTGNGELRDSCYAIEGALRDTGYDAHVIKTPAGAKITISPKNNRKNIAGLVEITKLNDDKYGEKWLVRSHDETEGQLIKGSIMGLRGAYNAKVERILDVEE